MVAPGPLVHQRCYCLLHEEQENAKKKPTNIERAENVAFWHLSNWKHPRLPSMEISSFILNFRQAATTWLS